MKHLYILISLLSVLVVLWFFQGCGENSDNFEVNIKAPDQTAKEAVKTLRVYAIISNGDEINCQNLMNGSVSPDDSNINLADNESVSDPINNEIRPLKVPKKHTGTLLFFSQGEDANGIAIYGGCTEMKPGEGARQIVISLDHAYTITFDGDGATVDANPTTITVTLPATTVGTLPTEPTKDGYTFGGWYTETNGGGTEFTTGTTVAASITVYAKWDNYSYTVTFDSDGATVATKTVDSPATTVVSLPTEPSKTGYSFVGWWIATGGGGTEFTASTVVTASITVYAYWTCTPDCTGKECGDNGCGGSCTNTCISPMICGGGGTPNVCHGWVTVGTAGFSAGEADWTSIAIDSSGTPYVVYGDYGNLDKATVMKFNGTNWVPVPVGATGISAGQADYTSIAIDSSGTPYVVYRDDVNGFKATVMKYTGMGTTGWVNVGTADFSDGTVYYTSIAIDSSGTPYVVYRDGVNSNKATAMKYTGNGTTGWVTVGTTGFSAGLADSTSIAIDSSGTPYVVYRDGVNSDKATVMKYTGNATTGWDNVGIAGFSAGEAEWTSIAIDRSTAPGTPYVVYKDYVNSNKATVMKYTGNGTTGWVTVGSPGFSAGEVYTTSIAIDSSGTPYVAYKDYGNSQKATVMKFNGTTWVTVGTAGFSAGWVGYTSIAIDPSGTPYVVYQDNVNSKKATVMKFQ